MFNIHVNKLQYPIHLTCLTYGLFFPYNFAKQFGHEDRKGYGSFMYWWTKRYGIVNKGICGSKESAAPSDELETWKEAVFIPTLTAYYP